MALQSTFEAESVFLKDAYIKIKKIVISDGIRERLEDGADGNSYVKYDKFFEASAIVYVYPDKETRDRNAIPVHQFGIEFDYSPSDKNIYTIAYDALKKTERFSDVKVKDI